MDIFMDLESTNSWTCKKQPWMAKPKCHGSKRPPADG